jgi:NAD+ synthetase
MKEINYSKTVSTLREQLKNYVINANLKSLVLGVSGGVDSALVAALVKPVADELNIPLIGRSISIHSNKPEEEERARLVGNAFCTDFAEVDLTEQYLMMKKFDDMEGISDDNISYKIRMGNIKARMRMIYLYNLSSKTNGMVLGTENLCEHYLGFFTKCGDEGSDFEMIKSLWKHEVYNITEWLANNGTTQERDALVPCIIGDATDGLGISTTDLDQILPDWRDRHDSTRSGYKEVDEIFIKYFLLLDMMKNDIFGEYVAEYDSELINIKKSPVIQRYFRTNFKRNSPYVIERNFISFI